MHLSFPTKSDVIEIHRHQIQQYGGSTGIRDAGLLESALAMPQTTFGGQYLHSSIYEMAAAYLFHIVSNHPFIDGNKRAGTVAALFFLKLNGLKCTAPGSELEALVLSVAQGESDKAAIAYFFRQHCKQAA